jgi:tRNA threonylcarbamoyladenosine biosynthesis protein TsaB
VLVLAIETATRRVGVALGDESGVLASITIGRPGLGDTPRHVEQLAPAIELLCRETAMSLQSVTSIAVGVGPGMFTGLRAGVTTAKTLGTFLRVPIVPVPTLDLLAYPLRHAHHDLVVPLIDARRREVYYALYRPVPGGAQRVTEPDAAEPEAIVAEITARGQRALCCGDGALRFRSLFERHELVELAGPEHDSPSLAALVDLAGARIAREEFADPDDVVPLYLRRPDAELSQPTP